MNNKLPTACTAFCGYRRIASGQPNEVVRAVKKANESGQGSTVLIYDDATGSVIDLDTRGSITDVVARLAKRMTAKPPAATPHFTTDQSEEHHNPSDGAARGRGRPKLGVIAREVTLLPRHWDWLGTQPGGASVALRKLVEAARRNSGDRDRRRAAQESAYRFMSTIAGDLPGFEEAARSLFADDRRGFADLVAAWPVDVRDHATKLAFVELEPHTT
jgi:hypothetical protein